MAPCAGAHLAGRSDGLTRPPVPGNHQRDGQLQSAGVVKTRHCDAVPAPKVLVATLFMV